MTYRRTSNVGFTYFIGPAVEMGGVRDKRRQESRNRRKLEGKSARQKRMEDNGSGTTDKL